LIESFRQAVVSSDPGGPLDRRQRKTRAALHAALLELIADRAYGSITVEDIVNAADLARATFYAHYRDKDDLLAAVNQQLLTDLMTAVADVSWRSPPAYTGIGVKTILRQVDQHRDLYRLLISGAGGPDGRNAIVKTFRETAEAVFTSASEKQARSLRLPMSLITTAFVGALLLTIEQWLEGYIDQDADAVAVDFMRGQAGGLEWALGFEPGDLTYSPDPE
jgi:AcrR family transcriptional regulator